MPHIVREREIRALQAQLANVGQSAQTVLADSGVIDRLAELERKLSSVTRIGVGITVICAIGALAYFIKCESRGGIYP
jgi:hypothetical protein